MNNNQNPQRNSPNNQVPNNDKGLEINRQRVNQNPAQRPQKEPDKFNSSDQTVIYRRPDTQQINVNQQNRTSQNIPRPTKNQTRANPNNFQMPQNQARVNSNNLQTSQNQIPKNPAHTQINPKANISPLADDMPTRVQRPHVPNVNAGNRNTAEGFNRPSTEKVSGTSEVPRQINRQNTTSNAQVQKNSLDIPTVPSSSVTPKIQNTQAKNTQLPRAMAQSMNNTSAKTQHNLPNKNQPSEILDDDDEDFDFIPKNKRVKEKKEKPKKEKVKHDFRGNTLLALIWAIVYIILIISVSVFLSVGIINVANDVFAFVKDDTVTEVKIPPLATLNDVADILYENGLIKYPTIFKLYAQIKDKDGEFNFVEGTYEMSPSLNYDEMRYMLQPTAPENEIIRLTIPEGYTTDEIIDLFVSNGIGTKEGFIETINGAAENEAFDYWFIDELVENGVSEDRFYLLDGYLFPDTYDFYTNSSETTVIKKFLDNFERKFAEEWRIRAEEKGMTVDEVINLAALIEKETRKINEFSTVSSVFTNRLNNPSQFPRLESDATIMYAMQHDTGERAESLTGADTSYDSPYNTYLNDGLPPGPIANPGYNAINYALYPQDTSYYYFVSDDTGTTYFATTHEEHIANINKVREINEQLQQ